MATQNEQIPCNKGHVNLPWFVRCGFDPPVLSTSCPRLGELRGVSRLSGDEVTSRRRRRRDPICEITPSIDPKQRQHFCRHRRQLRKFQCWWKRMQVYFLKPPAVWYPDKAVEIGKTAWPSRGQAPGKTVINGPTTWTSRTGRPGQTTKEGHRVCDRGTRTAGNTRRTRGPTGFKNVATRSRRKTQGSPARPKDEENNEEDKKRTKGGRRVKTTRTDQKERRTGGRQEEEDKKRTKRGQEQDKSRTRGGQEEVKRRTRGGQEKDKRKRTTTGQEEEERRTRGRQEQDNRKEDKRTSAARGQFRGAASQCGQLLLFPKTQPVWNNSKPLGPLHSPSVFKAGTRSQALQRKHTPGKAHKRRLERA